MRDLSNCGTRDPTNRDGQGCCGGGGCFLGGAIITVLSNSTVVPSGRSQRTVLAVCRVRVPPKPPPGSLCRPENLKALGRDILGISAALVVLHGQFTAVPSLPLSLSLSLSLSPFSTHPLSHPPLHPTSRHSHPRFSPRRLSGLVSCVNRDASGWCCMHAHASLCLSGSSAPVRFDFPPFIPLGPLSILHCPIASAAVLEPPPSWPRQES
jgi:hypothetical protein